MPEISGLDGAQVRGLDDRRALLATRAERRSTPADGLATNCRIAIGYSCG
jgi:hypothetical protein